MIKRLQAIFGGSSKGNVYWVSISNSNAAPGTTVANDSSVADAAIVESSATVAPQTTVVPPATNKYDDEYKKQSSSKGDKTENHRQAAAPRERHESAVGSAYERLTGNRWSKTDSASYTEHKLDQVPAEKIISVLEAVTRHTPFKINSFRYFIKEIQAKPGPRNRAWQKRKLAQIVLRIRDNSVGRADYSSIDFLEDVKGACAREAVPFNDDLFNELAG